MGDTLYQIYRKQVFELASTMVIRMNDCAVAINNGLLGMGINVQLEQGPGPEYDERGVATGLIVDYFKPEYTWKYYRNLAGLYHHTDTPIKIQRAVNDAQPLSTEELTEAGLLALNAFAPQPPGYVYSEDELSDWWDTVLDTTVRLSYKTKDRLLTKSLVASDPTLAYEYRYGTLFYTDLIARYPNQEVLINGIFNPVSLDVAVEARDGEILYAGDQFRMRERDDLGVIVPGGRTWFEPRPVSFRSIFDTLIEENELSIIEEIEYAIHAFLVRWHIRDYMLTDDLYLPAMLGIMYMQLPSIIMNLRLANVHTPRAHSYHIREYLDSHGVPSQYVPILNKKQALWLYRNTTWIEQNIGQHATFKELIDKLIIESKFPLYGYDTRHNTSNMITTVTDLALAENGTVPDSEMTRIPISGTATGLGSVYRTVSEIVTKESQLSRQGADDLTFDIANITQQLNYSNDSELRTKVLESVAVDESDAIVFPLSDMLLNLAIYYITMDIYTADVYFTHPGTGMRRQLRTKEALILLFYAHNRGHCDITLPNVPTIGARNIPRAAITANTSTNLPSDLPPLPKTYKHLIDNMDRDNAPRDYIGRLLRTVKPEPLRNSIINSRDFYLQAKVINDQLMQRYRGYVALEDMDQRAFGENACMQMYWAEVPCDLSIGLADTTYNAWLTTYELDFTGVGADGFRSIALELLTNITGIQQTGTYTVRQRQDALLAVMRHFTSYGIQYIQTTIDDQITPLDWKNPRLSQLHESYADTVNLPLPTVVVILQSGYITETADIGGVFNVTAVDRLLDKMDVDPTIQIIPRTTINTSVNLALPTLGILDFSIDDQSLSEVMPVNILDGFWNQ